MPRHSVTPEIGRDNGPYVPDGRVSPLFGGRWSQRDEHRDTAEVRRREELPDAREVRSVRASATSVVLQDCVVVLVDARRR